MEVRVGEKSLSKHLLKADVSAFPESNNHFKHSMILRNQTAYLHPLQGFKQWKFQWSYGKHVSALSVRKSTHVFGCWRQPGRTRKPTNQVFKECYTGGLLLLLILRNGGVD